MDKAPSFKLPKSFLSQLGEFTTGYVLVSVNEEGEFETFIKADSPALRLALGRFITLLSDRLEEELACSFGEEEEGDGQGQSSEEAGSAEEDTL